MSQQNAPCTIGHLEATPRTRVPRANRGEKPVQALAWLAGNVMTLSAAPRLVLRELCEHADWNDRTHCRASVDLLCLRLGHARSWVQTQLSVLKAQGYVVVTANATGGRPGQIPVYEINYEKLRAEADLGAAEIRRRLKDRSVMRALRFAEKKQDWADFYRCCDLTSVDQETQPAPAWLTDHPDDHETDAVVAWLGPLRHEAATGMQDASEDVLEWSE